MGKVTIIDTNRELTRKTYEWLCGGVKRADITAAGICAPMSAMKNADCKRKLPSKRQQRSQQQKDREGIFPVKTP